MVLTTAKKKYLNSLYYNPAKPGSFQSAGKISHTVKKEGKFSISLKEIKIWLRGQDTYTLTRETKLRFPKSHVITAGINDIFEADLADLQGIKKKNDNYAYLLGAICVFSRKLYVRPLKTKAADHVIEAFESILKEVGSKVNSFRLDMGSEFTNSKFKSFMKSRGVGVYHSHGQSQANYIERTWKSLKARISRYRSANRTDRYIDKLQSFVSSYNDTYHTGLGRRPSEVSKSNEHEVRYDQYIIREKRKPRNFKSFVNKKAKFSIGDSCRIAKRKGMIATAYREQFSREIYFIHKAFRRQGIPVYSISDQTGEVIQGTFYESELQRVDIPPKSKLYEIERIIRRKTENNKKYVFVKWRGFNKKFSSWLEESELEDALK